MATKIIKDNRKAILDAVTGDMLSKAVMAGAFTLETAIKISMSASSHSGKVYRKKNRSHKASAPGETPSVETAVLVNSIKSELLSASASSATANVGTGVEYAPHLEFGTSKMDKRPFMRPAFDNNVDRIKKQIRDMVLSNLKGASS